eukprot:TRINITY_DN1350_c0_g1_i1.p1 TRINITY_DN1350_c0_g1~~TRINITY_DN1350_c0_g1_i1.p1  ORF type:complete len:310 (-),score=58.79 TRINITY_DN1350_c0_g1_i1:150-1079(-)
MSSTTETKMKPPPERKNPILHGLAGAGAGGIAALITCPLDVIKTLLQVQVRKKGVPDQYNGIIGTGKVILKREGVRGLYKGLGTTFLALVPNWGVYFYSYNSAKKYGYSKGYEDGTLFYICCSIFAAAVTDVVTTPLWLVKTRLQTQLTAPGETRKYKNTFNAFSVIVKEEGFFSLWKGLTPQLIGIIHVAIQFPLYEFAKKYSADRKNKTTDELTPLELAITSSFSKISASTIAYPHEVLRSRFQSQRHNDPNRYIGLRNAITRILAEEGIAGFYRGLGTNLIRTTPSCAIIFTTYELLARLISKYQS